MTRSIGGNKKSLAWSPPIPFRFKEMSFRMIKLAKKIKCKKKYLDLKRCDREMGPHRNGVILLSYTATLRRLTYTERTS
jgi:hypothetical protein